MSHVKVKMLQLVPRSDSDWVSSMKKCMHFCPTISCTVLLMHNIWNRGNWIMDHAVTQMIGYQPLTRQTEVQSQASLCGICGAQSGTIAYFSPNTSLFPSVSFHQCSASIQSSITGTAWASQLRVSRTNTVIEMDNMIIYSRNYWSVSMEWLVFCMTWQWLQI